MNGKPAVLTAVMRKEGKRTHVPPLFTTVQPWMKSGPPPDEMS
jgi:hypothetical protein